MINWKALHDSKRVKTRFFTTFFVNIAKIGLSFIAGIIIARSLGPAGYGNFSFLLGSFVSITVLLDLGTSSAFYTFLSQKKHSPRFYLYYLLWIGIQFALAFSFITFLCPSTWKDKIWLGHTKNVIILAFLASFMVNQIWSTIIHVGESIRATVIVQLYNITLDVSYLCLVLAIFFLDQLTIPNLFMATIFIHVIFAFVLAMRLKGSLFAEEEEKLPNVINEFKTYCTPLVFYSIVSFFYSFANFWLLQKFSGAIQQGYYSVGFRFSALCVVATTSIVNVFWKEVGAAHVKNNKKRLHKLYTKTTKGLFFIGGVGACFLIPFSKEMLVFLLGPKYESGWLCLAIILIYPIYKSLGLITGTYLYATGQTKLRAKVGIISMLVSIPATYFMLAPSSNSVPGLGLGAVGLAIKMVISAIVFVNIYAYFISRFSGWKFEFLFQFKTIGFLLISSFAIKAIFNWAFHISNISLYPLALMIFCSPIYMLAVGLILYFFPDFSGLERKQITDSFYRLSSILRIKRNQL